MIVLRSALRLSVWLFGFDDKIFCIDNTLMPAFGQNRGKVTNSVSRSICKRVLAPHHGHKTQRFSSPTSFMLFSPSFCNQTQPWQ